MKLPVYGPRLRRVARQQFGWPSLRPGQFKPMRAVLRRRDTLVVLPTGAGKSAIYQIPAVLLPGPTVVISPLLALQQDQIAALNERGDPRIRAVRVSSAETPNQQREAIREIREGRAEFLFITPEQLSDPDRLAEVRGLKPGLVAVDEAHCISAWGHDFRPDYLALGDLIKGIGRPPVLALTATASPAVRDDIIERLQLDRPGDPRLRAGPAKPVPRGGVLPRRGLPVAPADRAARHRVAARHRLRGHPPGAPRNSPSG